jgi:hypothetical protein
MRAEEAQKDWNTCENQVVLKNYGVSGGQALYSST